MSSEVLVQSCDADSYGDSYKNHCLEMYKLYVEMADRVSARRQTANSFFLTVNTALLAAAGYLSALSGKPQIIMPQVLTGIAGIVLCFLWYRIVKSYKGLNSAKFKVVHEIEKFLPYRCYDAEWDAAGRGSDPSKYLPVSHIEMKVPWVFMVLHLIVIIWYISTLVISILALRQIVC